MSAAFPLADLIVRIIGDMSQFSREMVRTETLLKKKAAAFTALESQGKSVMNALGKAAAGFGSAFAAGITIALGSIAALVGALTAFSAWAIKTTTAADELRNRFKVTFGTEAQKAAKELADFADSVGRSRLELMDMAATLQNVFTAMGFTIGQSASLSVTIAKLGTDIASFHDIADGDAVDRLSSALVGNHEALRSLGIVMTEGAVKQQLIQMGFKGASDSATDQQKILARLAIILRATSLMQNDAAATAGSMSNQFKGLWGVIKDLADTWGAAFIPAMKIIVSALRDVGLHARNNTGFFQQLGAVLAGWATATVAMFQEVFFALANYDLAWRSLVLTVQEAVAPIGDAFNWAAQVQVEAFAWGRSASLAILMNFASAAVAIFNYAANMIEDIWNKVTDVVLDGIQVVFAGINKLAGMLRESLDSNWYQPAWKREFTDFLGDLEKRTQQTKLFPDRHKPASRDTTLRISGIDEFNLPEFKKNNDLMKERQKLEDEWNARRAKAENEKTPMQPFQAPDLKSMFDEISGAGKKAEIKVSMADSVSAWRDGIMDAFKNSDAKMQTKLQQQMVGNQEKQIAADKQNTDALTNALANSGGGFY